MILDGLEDQDWCKRTCVAKNDERNDCRENDLKWRMIEIGEND